MQRFHRATDASATLRTLALVPSSLTEHPRRSGERCRDCGAPMLERETTDGRRFQGCFRFPECKGGALLIARRARSLERRSHRGPVRKTQDQMRCRAAKAGL